ncbi:MAG: PKD domain-containing protein [Bacteroidia bacterium]|nr:PKD domain-containing protein [Bacteroidia bacterium]
MKKFFTLLILLGFYSLNQAQVYIQTYPHFEDFESFNTCGTAAGTACALPVVSGWVNATNDDYDWTVDVGGTPSSNTGPAVDHNPGTSTGKYLYTESSSPASPSKTFHLLTPRLDFSSLLAPSVDFWYHMMGGTMGTMHLDVSTDLGTTWSLDIVPAWTDNQNLWQKKSVGLAAYAGDTIILRIRGISGSSFESDMAVDDFKFYELPPVDLGVTAIDSLSSGCGLGMQTVAITITAFGSNTYNAGTMIPVGYSYGGTTVLDTITLTSSLAPGGTVSYNFPVQANFSTPNTYNVQAWTSMPGDTSNMANDTMSVTIISIPLISGLPYFEDFESNQGGWTASGTNSTWAWGVPAGSFINGSSGCGNSAWVTNLTGPYNNSEVAYLNSPCIDFSAISVDPTIRFDLIVNTETSYDNVWLEVSVNGGTSFTKVGAFGTGINWYNNSVNNYWEGSPFPSGTWFPAQNTLTGVANQSNVVIRFVFTSDGSVTYDGVGVDNITIFNTLDDIAPLALTAPASGCGLTNAETISFTVVNSGTSTITSVPACYSINSGGSVCDTFAANIAPGGTATFTFSTPGDFSMPGQNNVEITTYVSGDAIACNNILNVTVNNVPEISTFPYLETFENGPGGWAASGTNNSWAFGTPAKTTIQGAGSGVNAWVTGGLGTGFYPNGENSWVIGPCFDFTNLPANPWIAIKVWWNAEFSWDGSNVQYSLDSGATWTNVGLYLDPTNWYTDNSIAGNPGGSQEGWSGRASSGNGSGGWVQATHPLPAILIGQPSVMMRVTFGSDGSVVDDGFAFDDFAIGTPQQVAIGPDTTVCGGYTLGTNQSFATYNWSTGATSASIQLLNTGGTPNVDTIMITAVDTLGFTSRDTAILTIDPAPFVDIKDTTVCQGASVVFDAGMAGLTYAWSSGGTSQTETISTAGSYTLSLGISGGCSYVDSFMVSNYQVVDLGPDFSFCSGDTTTIDAGAFGSTFMWSNSATTQTIDVTAPGDYSVTVTDVHSCVSADTVNAGWFAVADLGPDTSVCSGSSLTLDPGIGGGTYLWSTSATTQTISVNAAGTYSVDVTDINGCMSSDDITVAVVAAPVASFTFTGTQTISFTDGSTGSITSWAWDFGDGGTSTVQNPSHTYAATGGSFTVTLTVTGPCGSNTFTQTVLITDAAPDLSTSVNVFPNPSTGSFRVGIQGLANEDVNIRISNLHGQLVRTLSAAHLGRTGEIEINLNDAPKGVYLVEVNFEGQRVIRKIVLE